jgi:hypothetical protein
MKLPSRLAPLAIPVVVWAIAVPPLHAEPLLRWGLLYDGGSSGPDFGTATLCDPAGNVIFGGESADGVAGLDQVIRKVDRASGETLWTARDSAFDGNDMALTGLAWDPFGDVLVGGYIRGCVG